MRIFFAIDLPKPLKEKIAASLPSLPEVRWVEPENLHITLQFIKTIDPELVATLVDKVRLSLKELSSFALETGKVAIFPTPDRPKFIYLSLQANPGLMRLVDTIRESIQTAGHPIEKRKFWGHITLGRFRRGFNPKDVSLNSLVMPIFPPIKVQDIILFHSQPSQTGSLYIPLSHLALDAQHHDARRP